MDHFFVKKLFTYRTNGLDFGVHADLKGIWILVYSRLSAFHCTVKVRKRNVQFGQPNDLCSVIEHTDYGQAGRSVCSIIQFEFFCTKLDRFIKKNYDPLFCLNGLA